MDELLRTSDWRFETGQEAQQCTVLAMRHPVTDDFAIALTGALYERLIGRRQPVVSTVSRALSEVVAMPPVPPERAAGNARSDIRHQTSDEMMGRPW